MVEFKQFNLALQPYADVVLEHRHRRPGCHPTVQCRRRADARVCRCGRSQQDYAADISDPQELIARADTLSVELGTTISPGFDALVFKASRGIEDIYELTYIRKDGSRFPAIVSVTALRDDQGNSRTSFSST